MTSLAPASFGVAPLASALLDDPIAFLAAEHARQLALLAHLERLARAPRARGARQMAGALLNWLTVEWPMHIADEEQSLYPRLRQHDTAGALARLAAEHGREGELVAGTAAGLRRLAAGDRATPEQLAAAAGFARLHRRHLAFEDADVAPLARRVLTPAAMRNLAGEMAMRRGLIGETTCPTES